MPDRNDADWEQGAGTSRNRRRKAIFVFDLSGYSSRLPSRKVNAWAKQISRDVAHDLASCKPASKIARMAEGSTHEFDDWQLTPEGAAIHPAEETAVVADLHLGYEWARGAAGDCVIAHSLEETLTRLALVLSRVAVTRLVVAGDFVESSRPCGHTREDVRRLREWLDGRGVSLLVLEGNHDRSLARFLSNQPRPLEAMPQTCKVASWTIGHGHVPIRARAPSRGTITQSFESAGPPRPVFWLGRAKSSCRRSHPMPQAVTLPRRPCLRTGWQPLLFAVSPAPVPNSLTLAR